MSGFFDSDMVRKSIMELDEIQQKLFEQVLNLSFYIHNLRIYYFLAYFYCLVFWSFEF